MAIVLLPTDLEDLAAPFDDHAEIRRGIHDPDKLSHKDLVNVSYGRYELGTWTVFKKIGAKKLIRKNGNSIVELGFNGTEAYVDNILELGLVGHGRKDYDPEEARERTAVLKEVGQW